ncbi:hypothetical protein ACT2FY_32245 [Paraburkholderia fungorum]|uniref:hypothetical protein n=1 Tax=Paraburkholderia fungorum TaxID=134537 RepID=UPI00402B75DA
MTLEEARAKVEDWLVKTSLYEEVAGSDVSDCHHAIQALILRAKPFDAHCVECKRAATFKPDLDDEQRGMVLHGTPEYVKQYCLRQRLFTVTATCARSAAHRMQFVFLHYPGRGVQKIGQYPSIADLSIPETSQFVKVLGQDRVRELNKAIGLAAHGVGVGSYIYLRRIFESLVEGAHKEAAGEGEEGDDEFNDWDEDAYKRARMDERITMLKDYLPKFLVEHPQLYGILSKHLHELSENDCLQNFDAMKEAILIIARDKLKANEEQEQRATTAKLLQKIGSTMKS